MYKYAEILNNRVHWIMEHEADVNTLYMVYFNKDQIEFVDITDNTQDIKEGWEYDQEAGTFKSVTFKEADI